MVTGLSPEKPDEALMVMIAGIILQLTAERKSNKGRAENQCGEVVQKLIARWLKHHKFGKREINKNSGLIGDCSINNLLSFVLCLSCCGIDPRHSHSMFCFPFLK